MNDLHDSYNEGKRILADLCNETMEARSLAWKGWERAIEIENQMITGSLLLLATTKKQNKKIKRLKNEIRTLRGVIDNH